MTLVPRFRLSGTGQTLLDLSKSEIFFETKSEPNERFRRQILAGNYLPTETSGHDNGNESRDFDFSHLRARLRCFIRGRTGRCAVLIGAAGGVRGRRAASLCVVDG